MNAKSFLASKTLWGVLVAALPAILGLFGLHITDVGTFTAAVQQNVDEITTLAGSAFAVYGRVKATANLVVKTPPAAPPAQPPTV